MRNEQNCRLLFLEFMELPHTAIGENGVPDRKRFVDNQNLRLDVNRGREGQTYIHPGRVLLHGSVDKFANFSKRLYGWQRANHLLPSKTENLAIQKHIFASREFGIEAGPEFQKCGYPASRHHT